MPLLDLLAAHSGLFMLIHLIYVMALNNVVISKLDYLTHPNASIKPTFHKNN